MKSHININVLYYVGKLFILMIYDNLFKYSINRTQTTIYDLAHNWTTGSQSHISSNCFC